jgi:hypothetical protein
MRIFHRLIVAALLALGAATAHAQDNYEIQVYGSEMGPPGSTMLELHTNFTAQGSKTEQNGIEPSNHAVHETLEITQSFTDWAEVGFYVFTSIQREEGWQWVGDHIRPRFRIPESWHWPVGLSLSQEIGYQQREFSPDTWTYELRPIIDKKMGRWYWSFNPTFDKSLHGENVDKGFEFSPNAKVSYDFTRKIAGGLEYYGSMGPVTDFDPLHDQQQQFFPAIDLNLSPKWEVNFGVGIGATASTDHIIVKFILGRRLTWGRGSGDENSQKPKSKPHY